MTEIISVRFRSGGKEYYFDPRGQKVKIGDEVIIETAKGPEFGICCRGNAMVEDDKVMKPLRPMLRPATDKDRETVKRNREREKEAFRICEEKIKEYKLEMDLVRCECSFDGNKLLFFFISEGRVDFRALVRDLAATLHSRIELRQIGVRDESKLLGGLGICGRPKNESFVETPDGVGTVTGVDFLKETVKVRLEEAPESPQTYAGIELNVIRNGKGRRPEGYMAPPKEELEKLRKVTPKLVPVEKTTGSSAPAGREEERRSERRQGSRPQNSARPRQEGKPQPPRARPSRAARTGTEEGGTGEVGKARAEPEAPRADLLLTIMISGPDVARFRTSREKIFFY